MLDVLAYGIDQRMLSRLIQQSQAIFSFPKAIKSIGSVAKAKFPELETVFFDWVKNQRNPDI